MPGRNSPPPDLFPSNVPHIIQLFTLETQTVLENSFSFILHVHHQILLILTSLDTLNFLSAALFPSTCCCPPSGLLWLIPCWPPSLWALPCWPLVICSSYRDMYFQSENPIVSSVPHPHLLPQSLRSKDKTPQPCLKGPAYLGPVYLSSPTRHHFLLSFLYPNNMAFFQLFICAVGPPTTGLPRV